MTEFKKPNENKTDKKDEWTNVGWINPSTVWDNKENKYIPNGKTLRVIDNDGNLVGYVLIKSLNKVLSGAIKGVPIKIRENP